METADDLRELLETVIAEVQAGHLNAEHRSQILLKAVEVGLKIVEVTSLEKRVALLESAAVGNGDSSELETQRGHTSMTTTTIARRITRLERWIDEEKNMVHTEKSRGYMICAQTQQELEKDPLYHEKGALLEFSSTAPSKWTCCIKDRMSEAIRRVFNPLGIPERCLFQRLWLLLMTFRRYRSSLVAGSRIAESGLRLPRMTRMN